MRVKVRYVIGKSTKVEFVDVAKATNRAVARALGISPRQIVSLMRG